MRMNKNQYPMPGDPITVDKYTTHKARRAAAMFLAKKAMKAMGFPRSQLIKFRDLYFKELSAANKRFIDGQKHS